MRADDRILVVDADQSLWSGLQPLLEKEGYLAGYAGTISAALLTLERSPCSLAIVAYTPGDTTGLHLIERLRERAIETAVILAGSPSFEAAQTAMRWGAADFLALPTTTGELAESMMQARSRYAGCNQRVAQPQTTDLSTVQRLAISLAHEINNPLTPILGMSELLMSELPPEHIGQVYAHNIILAARRIRDTIRNLVDYTRPEYEQSAPIDIGRVLLEARPEIQEQYGSRLFFDQTALSGTPMIVVGVPALLIRMLRLLIEHAAKAQPDCKSLRLGASVRHNTSITSGRAAQRYVAITIQCDDAANTRDTWFPPGRPAGAHVVSLGLSVATSIAVAHSGSIEIIPNDPHGNLYRVILPVI